MGCCPSVVRDRKNSWLKAFCLPRLPATFVPLHICQGWCPIAQCQAGKSAPCHFWHDNWSLSQVCNQFFFQENQFFLSRKKMVLKIKPANLKAEACMQQKWPCEGLVVSLRTHIRSCNETMYFKIENPLRNFCWKGWQHFAFNSTPEIIRQSSLIYKPEDLSLNQAQLHK